MKLPVPDTRVRVAQRLNKPTSANGLQGSATPDAPTATVTSGQTYSEVVACPGSARIRVRILTGGAGAGTLNVKPIAPVATLATDESVLTADGRVNPAKVTIYGTGTGTAAVAAATETKVDLDLYGENYVLVQFVCTGTGTLVWCDVSQV
jgi:hypothetical protein